MLSKALTHYPQFRFRDGKKMLWNPILKKTFINRPEERFRLELVDYLTLEANFSSHRISFESPVKLPSDKSTSRTDIICYDDDFKPLLLVECKSGDIKLNEKAALQVARYNQKVKAKYLLVSNGLLDYWFDMRKQLQNKVERTILDPLGEVPTPFEPKSETERSFQYWQERAFAGFDSHPDSRFFIRESCDTLFTQPREQVVFINFDNYSPEFSLANYYRVFKFEENTKLAVSISATPFGGTRLNVVLNREGANVAFLSASLDLIAKEEKANTEIHSSKGELQVDLISEVNFHLRDKVTNYLSPLKELLIHNC